MCNQNARSDACLDTLSANVHIRVVFVQGRCTFALILPIFRFSSCKVAVLNANVQAERERAVTPSSSAPFGGRGGCMRLIQC